MTRAKKITLVVLLGLVVVGLAAAILLGTREKRYHTAQEFGVETVRSPVDFDGDGVDDYADFLLGARQDAENRPRYDPAYWSGGYPPEDVGVCTDVIWRAFRRAGYSLRDMVDRDIRENLSLYPRVAGKPDSNIDFRRVKNLMVYFSRKAVPLTTDITQIDQWQPGDIVIYGDNHIAMVSDRRNAQGRPYILHNAGQLRREEDALDWGPITGHYRFDASRLSPEDLVPWQETA